MKTVLFALSALSVSAPSFAASSFCEVFITEGSTKPYETITTCDGQQGAVVQFDDSSVGTVIPMTKATQLVLQKGYALANCTGTGINQACFLSK